MKINFTGKFKIWVLITVSVLIVGFVLFGVLGFNQNANFKNSYNLNVKVDANIGDAADLLRSTTDNYLSDKKVACQTVSVYDDGGELVYNFSQDVKANVSCDELKTAIKTSFSDNPVLSGLTVDVTLNNTVPYTDKVVGGIAIALAVLAVATFIYALIMEKLGGALSILVTSVISGLLFFAIVGAVRIPATPFMGISVATAFIFGGVYSSVLVNRFNNSLKNNSAKLSAFEIVNKDTNLSFLRLCFLTIIIIVLGVLLANLGNALARALGLQTIVLAITCLFSSIAFTGVIWAGLSAKSKTKAVKESTEEVKE